MHKISSPKDPQTEFEEACVRLLFKRIREGRFQVSSDCPRTAASLSAVKLDPNAEPVFETVNQEVRTMARFLARLELDQAKSAKLDSTQMQPPKPTPVNEQDISKFERRDEFTKLSFDLFQEAMQFVLIGAGSYLATARADFPHERDQAICVGILVRTCKLMSAVCRLGSTGNGLEANLILLRSISESIVNLRFLISKNDPSLFDKFVNSSLGPERELFDLVTEISGARGCLVPIEERILEHIHDTCRISGVPIEKVLPGHQTWGAGMKQKLKHLSIEERYCSLQRIPSHSVHGDWVDLVTYHLNINEGRYGGCFDFSPETPAFFLPAAAFVLDGLKDYMNRYFQSVNESQVLISGIEDLLGRLRRTDELYETWIRKSKESASDAPDQS